MPYAINDLDGTEIIAISPVLVDMVSEFYCCNEVAKIETVQDAVEFTDPNGHIFCTVRCCCAASAVQYTEQLRKLL